MKQLALFLTLFLFFLSNDLQAKIDSTQFFETTKGCKIYSTYFNKDFTFKWNGNCKDGFASGKGICEFLLGDIEFGKIEGEFINGVPTGTCSYFIFGTKIECEFVDGRMFGEGTKKSDDGDYYVGKLIDTYNHGRGKITYSNGTKFEGIFRKGLFWTGIFTDLRDEKSFYFKGESVEKLYPESTYSPKLNTELTEYFDADWNRCPKAEAEYYRKITYKKQNIPDGLVKDYYINGRILRTYYLRYVDYSDEDMNFVDKGEFRQYYESGKLYETGNFNFMGNRFGAFESYHENERLLSSFNYSKFGKMDGEFIVFDQEGDLTRYGAFDSDRLRNDKSYIIDNGFWQLLYNENFKENFSFWNNSNDDSQVVPLGDGLLLNNSNTDYYYRKKKLDISFENKFSVLTEIRIFKDEYSKKIQAGLVFDFVDEYNYTLFYIDGKQFAHVDQYINGNVNKLASLKLDKSYFSQERLDFILRINFWEEEGVAFVVNEEIVHQMYKWNWGNPASFGLFYNKGKTILFNGFQTIEFFDEETSVNFSDYVLNKELNGGDDSGYDGNGTGFLVSQEGHIVTNYHVIENASTIDVQFNINGEVKVFPAKVMVNDKINDLSILRLEEEFEFEVIPYFIDFNTQDVGENIFTLGYPMIDVLGSEIKYTNGEVSSKTGVDNDIRVYQISAPIQPGNSGGPLFNNQTGNIVGIINATLNRQEYDAENVNYALKTSLLKTLIDSSPEKIILPRGNNKLKELNKTERIKQIKSFVPAIMIKY